MNLSLSEQVINRKARLGVLTPDIIAARRAIRAREAVEAKRRAEEAKKQVEEEKRRKIAEAVDTLRRAVEARKFLGMSLRDEGDRYFMAEILAAVSDIYGVTRNDIMSHRRTQRIVIPRQIAIWASRELTLRSLPQIGRFFGGRDHTTVLFACRKIERIIASGEMQSPLPEIMESIKSTRATLLGEGA